MHDALAVSGAVPGGRQRADPDSRRQPDNQPLNPDQRSRGAESLRRRTGTPLAAPERADIERATATVSAALGARTLTGLMEQGRHMSLSEATSYAGRVS